ncbi:MAG: C10 family peptidase [Bacteroidales bacterium]|nr:C10 family peptidase [Bacteroidales bacterium]
MQPTETTLTDPKSDSYLLTSTWEQGYGYNNYCPVMNGQHVVVGCVATAMAQIIRYYGKPTRGFGRKSYVHTAYGALAVDFDTTDYDYSLMPDHIRHSSPANQKDMVSRLCYHCGIVVNMEYQHAGHTSGSGAHTSNVPEGLTHFGYTDALHYTRSNINNDSLWVAMIHNEIDNRRPIEYSGFGDDGGHAFVLDGYNNQDQFHFNWGWGGYADGFYTLSTMAGFTSNHEMVINIYPSGWDGHLTRFLVSPDGEGDGTSWDEANRNINAAVQLNKLVNRDIWMKEGYYFGDTNNYYLYDFRYPATIIGGFAGTETSISQHDPKNHPTILEGRHNHGVLYAQAQAYGNRQLKIQDIIIQDGFSYDGDIVSIINNTIAKNITIRTSASINGNVLYAKDSRIIAADIYGNWGPTICLLSGAIMRQSLVYNNERLADNVEGTIILMQNDSRVVNCDIVSNHSTGVVFKHPRNSFVNNIVWNNEENLRFDTVLNDTAFRHCAIEGDSLVGDSTCILLNSSNDHAQGPRFVNPSIRRENAFASPDLDWHLDRGSICIDAGERLSESLADGDHDQSLRCRNKIVDIGCYESNYPVGIAPTEDRTAPSVHPNPASGTLTVSNCGQAGVQIFDITGRKVMESQAKGSTIRLDISQLPQGVYFLKSGESTLKVVKR